MALQLKRRYPAYKDTEEIRELSESFSPCSHHSNCDVGSRALTPRCLPAFFDLNRYYSLRRLPLGISCISFRGATGTLPDSPEPSRQVVGALCPLFFFLPLISDCCVGNRQTTGAKSSSCKLFGAPFAAFPLIAAPAIDGHQEHSGANSSSSVCAVH